MVPGRVRQLSETGTSIARNPELAPGPAVLGIDPPAEDYLCVQPTRAEEEHPADSDTSHSPEASDDR